MLCSQIAAGRGRAWEAEGQALWWVDILGRKLHRAGIKTGSIESWDQLTEIIVSNSSGDGRRALVLRDRVELFDPATGERQFFWRGSEPLANRFNDAGLNRENRGSGFVDDNIVDHCSRNNIE